jgi:hypothetical protein
MADQFDAFQKEVEEDLQRERMQKMWEQYGTYILAAAAAIVLAVAGWKFADNRRQAAAENNAVKFSTALKQLSENKTEDGQKTLAALGAEPGGYGLIAKLRLAASKAAEGKADEAFAAYDAVSRQSGVDKVIADYARLQAALLKADSAPWTETKTRLIDLVVDGNPWRHGARELLGFSAFRAGQLAEARAEFEKLVADRTTPAAMSERAGIIMAQIIQAELAKAGAAQPSGTPAPAVDPKAAPQTPGTKTK